MERWGRRGTTGWAPIPTAQGSVLAGGEEAVGQLSRSPPGPALGPPLPVWRGRDGGRAQLQASVCLKFQHLQNIGPRLLWGDVA